MAPALNFERYNDWTKQNELYPKKSEFPSHVNPTFSILYNKILKMVKKMVIALLKLIPIFLTF